MKCEQYWPVEETEECYGLVKVKCRSIENFAEYTVRSFTVSKDKEQRNLTQMHFTAWPDKGIPSEVTSLVDFRQRVKTASVVCGVPVIVHCSAGVARTGTYIALDILSEKGMAERSVNVFNCVQKMRRQRVNMVQTVEQYIFLHKALAHTLTFGCEAQTAEEIQCLAFGDTITNMFQTLNHEVDVEREDDVVAQEEIKRKHADKSRSYSDIPGNRGRVHLFLRRKAGEHDYINAVFIDDVGIYLPEDNETRTYGDFTVTSSGCETKPHFTVRKISIKHSKQGEERMAYHFQYTKLGNGQKVAESPEDFVLFIKEDEKHVNKRLADTPNVVVHCLNGYERSGLFCVVYTMLEKVEAERQVSVVNVIRKVRAQRKLSTTSVDKLKFCYQCVSAYLESFNLYSNFAT